MKHFHLHTLGPRKTYQRELLVQAVLVVTVLFNTGTKTVRDSSAETYTSSNQTLDLTELIESV